MKRRLYIPGFSRYEVEPRPFKVWDTKNQRWMKPIKRKRGAPTLKLFDDRGIYRQWSIWTFAALAYHGQPPNNCIAHCYSDEITRETVRWINRKVAASYRSRAFNLAEREKILELYYLHGLTQDVIAERFDVSQSAISRAISKQGREV